jgi:hypothetical protein
MALTLTRATVANEEGTNTSIPNTTTVNIPGTATCLWIAWAIADQGTTARTFTVQYNGVSLANDSTNVVARKTDATSGPSFAVYRVLAPTSGSAVTIQVTSSPAFNNRQYRVMVVYAEGGATSTPDDSAVMTDTGAVTLLSQACDSFVGDMVLSFCAVDSRTTAATAPTGTFTSDLGELNTAGAVYMGAIRADGTGSPITNGWGWGGGSSIAAQISFNVNVAAAGGGGSTDLLVARFVRGKRPNKQRRAA